MLKQMVANGEESRGAWPDVLPMCLFFIRITPNAASEISPFMGGSPTHLRSCCIMHGWANTWVP